MVPIPRASRLYLHLSSASSLPTLTFSDLIPLLQLPPDEAEVCLLMSTHSTVSDRFLPCMASITLQEEILFDVNSADGESVVSRMTLHVHDLLRVSRKLPDAYGEEFQGNPFSGFRIAIHTSERIAVLYATSREVHREWMSWLDDRISSAKQPEPRLWRSASRESTSNNSSSALQDGGGKLGELSSNHADAASPGPPSFVHRPVELYETSRPFPGHMMWCVGSELADAFPDLTLGQLEIMRRVKHVEGVGSWSEIGQADPFVLDDRDNALFNGSEPWTKERFAPTQYLSNVAGLPTVKDELTRVKSVTPTFAQHAAKWITPTPWIEFVSSEHTKRRAGNEAKRLLLRRISSLRLALEDLDIRRLPYNEEEVTPIEQQVSRTHIPLPVDITPLEVPLFWEKHYDATRHGIIRMRESFAQRLRKR